MDRKMMGGLAAATAMTAALGFAMAPAQAGSDDNRVTNRGDCSLGSTWFLRAGAHDQGQGHSVRVLFRIHSAGGGQVWDWQISDNGMDIKTGQSVSDQGGNVTVRRRIPNQQGSDVVDFTATNTTTGEVCTGEVTL